MRAHLETLIRAELSEINQKYSMFIDGDEQRLIAEILAERLTIGRDPHRSGRRIYDRLRERLMSLWDRYMPR